MRTLDFVPALGAVDLTLKFAGGELRVTAPPLLATAACHFEDRASWPLADLAAAMQVLWFSE